MGENDYASLMGDPNALLFSTTQPGSIVNAGNLAVGEGQNLSVIGGTVVNTGTLSAAGDGNVTVAAIPGERRVLISHPDMLLSLELYQVEVEANGLASALSLSELLTGGNVTVATGVEVDEAGRTWLRGTEVSPGDVAIAGNVIGGQVQLAAANRVTVVGDSEKLITTHNGSHSAPIVTRFSSDGTDAAQLVFLDTTVPDYTRLLFGAADGTTTVAIPVSENGIARVTDVLHQVDAADAVHIVSEGNEGEFWLGNAYVSNETLEQYKAQLQQWGGLLSAEADILIYACLIARGTAGLSLLNEIASLTGADVAGSIDLTGNEANGGDWLLERSVGQIEAGRAFETITLEEYDGLLQVFTATDAASLIAAINTANGNAEADTINLANDITLTAVDNMVDGPNGLPSILADGGNQLTINGMGNTLARDAAAPNFRLMHVALGGDLEINETTLSGGIADTGSLIILLPADSGGAIFNRGTLTLNDSIVSGNEALNDGGGIYSTANAANAAAVNINRSIISGNTAGDNGGGLANSVFVGGGGPLPNASVMTITESLITGNTANDGGGVSNFGQNGDNGSVMNIRSSTISGNTARFTGGGVYNRGQSSLFGSTVILTNSTVVENEVTNVAGLGGGIFNTGFFGVNSGRVIVGNSIIAQNTASTGTDVHQAAPIANAPVVDQGNNLIGVDSQTLFTTSTLVGSMAAPLDPELLPLGDYGGPTQTHAFYLGSPVRDTGSDALATTAGLTTDNRGAPRFNGAVDIGAFESQGYSLTVTGGNNQSTLPGDTFGTNLGVQVTEDFVNSALPIPGVNVTFTVNPGSSGASGNPVSSTSTTDATGFATTSPLTANDIAGDFTVTASSPMLGDATFNLTNTSLPPVDPPPVDPPDSTLPTSELLSFWIDIQEPLLTPKTACGFSPPIDVAVNIPGLADRLPPPDIDKQGLGTACEFSLIEYRYRTSNTTP